jgi:AcrR family transcriptional regulator
MTIREQAPKSRAEVVAALYELFRKRGYDGVSLADISEATGLGKSSLYHYFPAGKTEMAEAVADAALAAMRNSVFAPLREPAPIGRKILAMIRTVDDMYAGGNAPCLVASMLPSGAAGERITLVITEWIGAIADALIAEGIRPASARARAAAAIAAIEGALIVAKATGDLKVFANALKSVKQELLSAH